MGGHEEEIRAQDRKGLSCQVSGVPWDQGKDYWRPDQSRSGREQARQDREQESSRPRKESIRKHQGLDRCCPEARKALGVKGFVAIKKGSALYKKAKELYQ